MNDDNENPTVASMNALASAMMDAGIPLMRTMNPLQAVDAVIGVLFYVAEHAGLEPRDVVQRVKIGAHAMETDDSPEEYEA